MKLRKKLAIIQGTVDDLYDSNNENDYSVGVIKSMSLFHDVVIACPDTKESNKVKELAELWGIDCFFGSVDNVLYRFLAVSNKYMPEIIARIQLRAFWVDPELIMNTIEMLENDIEYIDYQNDVNYALGIDLFTFEALKKVDKLISSELNVHKKHTFEFSPWALMRDKSKFNVAVLNYQKKWDKKKVRKIKSKLNDLIGNDENQQGVTPENPGSRYRMAESFLNINDIVLDIACGKGGGTKFCSGSCKQIHGFDYNVEYINHAKLTYINDDYGNVFFHYGTDNEISKLDIKFDKVISLHTLEHADNDFRFLKNIKSSLKLGGMLILEVPRLLEYPLGEPLFPFHEREYTLSGVRELLVNAGFEIIKEKGGNRNNYTDVENARETLVFIAINPG